MDINGIRLFYKDMGYGQTVILLHGYNQSSDLFRSVDQHLAKRYRVVLIDSRGQGQSGRNEMEFSTTLMAQDVVGVMDKLKIDKATIIGFSDGANIALQLGVDFPNRLRKVVAISANARPEGIRRARFRPIQIWKRIRAFLGFNTDMLSLLLDNPQITDDQLSAISVPMLLIFGNRDIVATEHMQLLHRLIPKSQLLLVPGATHRNIIKKWRKYGRAVDDFVAAP